MPFTTTGLQIVTNSFISTINSTGGISSIRNTGKQEPLIDIYRRLTDAYRSNNPQEIREAVFGINAEAQKQYANLMAYWNETRERTLTANTSRNTYLLTSALLNADKIFRLPEIAAQLNKGEISIEDLGKMSLRELMRPSAMKLLEPDFKKLREKEDLKNLTDDELLALILHSDSDFGVFELTTQMGMAKQSGAHYLSSLAQPLLTALNSAQQKLNNSPVYGIEKNIYKGVYLDSYLKNKLEGLVKTGKVYRLPPNVSSGTTDTENIYDATKGRNAVICFIGAEGAFTPTNEEQKEVLISGDQAFIVMKYKQGIDPELDKYIEAMSKISGEGSNPGYIDPDNVYCLVAVAEKQASKNRANDLC